jgi:mono/diheme cytochrome c family protein
MKRLTARRFTTGFIWVLGATTVGFAIFAWESTLPPVDPPDAGSFDAKVVRHGSELAALGGCVTCHTVPDGDVLAGGRAVPTPFGTIYSTNITPDAATGIGRWSPAAFQRAMREGVDREGRHLYPAFPYDHFTLVSDSDDAALYAYLMTRQPVQARPHENSLPFPLNIRQLLAGWKLLFLRKGPFEPDPTRAAEWNRGAYLAGGIGHCGACHTPRNSFGAEISAQRFSGGDTEGWRAYAINRNSQASHAWDADALYAFLRVGWHDLHGDAQGPMAPVAADLASAADADIRAIATYVGWEMRKTTKREKFPQQRNDFEAGNATGAEIYTSACAGCHDGARPLPFGGIKLDLSTAVTGDSANNLINVVLEGLQPPAGTAGAIMPGFASSLTDGQLESLVAYVRSKFGTMPPWGGVETSVREARDRSHD